MVHPKEALEIGGEIVGRVLAPHGFDFKITRSGKGSGGHYATAEFIRGDRRLELHFRNNLGLVAYHLGSLSVSHGAYMRELGVAERCHYPGFPSDPLLSFEHLAHDLKFVDDFINGSGEVLAEASKKEVASNAEQDARLLSGYVGDTRKIESLRICFKDRRYKEVLSVAESIEFPERMKESDRRMVDIARRRLQSR